MSFRLFMVSLVAFAAKPCPGRSPLQNSEGAPPCGGTPPGAVPMPTGTTKSLLGRSRLVLAAPVSQSLADQARILPDHGLDFRCDILVLGKKKLGILAALADPVALEGEP